jgi:integrase
MSRALRAATPNRRTLPPKRGDSRQRPWLYPSEWAKVASSAEVPVEWRQLYAVALYTGLRPGELRALTWADVDSEARTLAVSKSHARESGIKAPKTLRGRRIVPLHEHVLPLARGAARRAGRARGAPAVGSQAR